jgi:hypothetical protein
MKFSQYEKQRQQGLNAPKKAWVAKKQDVVRLWNSLRDDLPLVPKPVSKSHSGNRFDQDGIRITGSTSWINSVLSKLKPLLFYSNHPALNLDVKYRMVPRRDLADKQSFACYINLIEKDSDR